MAEYIRLDTTIIGIDSLINKAPTAEEAKVLFTAKDVIYSQQRYVMDVQPDNQWISVNDRLPENAKPCAVMTEDNGLGVSRYMGRNRFEWTLFGELILYWMPLPEPPKDGEHND